MGLTLETKAIRQVARMHLKKEGQTYVACEEINFLWTNEEVFDFDCMWEEGYTLQGLAKHFIRPQEEILLLALDRAEKGRIKPRQGGLIGTLNREVEGIG